MHASHSQQFHYSLGYCIKIQWYQLHFLLNKGLKSTSSATQKYRYARAVASDLQYCSRRVCLPARQCTSTLCMWNSGVSVPQNIQLMKPGVASQQSWAKSNGIAYRGHDAGVCILSVNPGCGQVVTATFSDKGWILAHYMAWWMMRLICDKQDRRLCQSRRQSHSSVTLLVWNSSCYTIQQLGGFKDIHFLEKTIQLQYNLPHNFHKIVW